MKDLKQLSRHVIIYAPNGKEYQFCTKDLGDSNIKVVDSIECDGPVVTVAYVEDGKIVGQGYNMPYLFEMW